MEIKKRPSEQFVEKICVICGKPVEIRLKYVRLKWGNDFRHKACYIKQASVKKVSGFAL